jgi:CBS domain-containing protein
MNIFNSMKKTVYSITPDTTVKQAAETFVRHHIGTLPVVDEQKKLVGILLIRDLITLVLPDFVNMMQDIDFVVDFGAAEARHPDGLLLQKPVSEVMQPPVFVECDCSLLRAAALFKKHNLPDLPVVDQAGHLIGIASLVDIGTTFLKSWP